MNLWILTEERPKNDVIISLLKLYSENSGKPVFFGAVRIIPEVENSTFTFRYKVLGIDSGSIDNIFIKTVSGKTSFVDFLIFYQELEPTKNDTPMFVVEETKTDDSESRNTGVYQRATKFAYIETVYGNIPKYMLYAGIPDEKAQPTDTNIFGTNCLLTIGVQFHGKILTKDFKPFESLQELIDFKSKMKKPPNGNVPIDIVMVDDNHITVSGRLVKSGRLGHDPNIGALSLICVTLRKLGFTGRIEIVLHGLSQKMLTPRNKFIRICNLYEINLSGLNVPKSTMLEEYWYFESSSEKLVTIFLHLLVEEFSNGYSIYENHAGCERGYFYTSDGNELAVQKYTDKALYKAGDKTAIYSLPDLVLVDPDRDIIFNIEGEKGINLHTGVTQIAGFDAFESDYIKANFPNHEVIRTIVLYGNHPDSSMQVVSLILTETGEIVLGVKPPVLFKDSVKNLIDYWA